MSILQESWSSFSSEVASKYLKGFGHPSEDSKRLLADVLVREAHGKPLKLIELGCGNGQLAEYFVSRSMDFTYLGVDFSDPLLEAARTTFAKASQIHFIKEDVERLESVSDAFDVAIFSHVIEMLSSPEAALAAAKRVAKVIAIRFFEPPDHETTRVELRFMDTGAPQSPPYLRWSMSNDYYRLILAKLGVKVVDVYQSRDRDQIHLLRFT